MQKRLRLIKSRGWETNKTEFKPLGKRLLLLDLDINLDRIEGKNLSLLRNSLQNLTSNKVNSLGIITGRSIDAARFRYSDLHLPQPQVWIARAGTEIHYSQNIHQPDHYWTEAISSNWNRNEIEKALSELKEHLILQDEQQQGPYKISYLLREPGTGILPLIRKLLRDNGFAALPHLRCHWYLDVLPLTASRAEAIRFLSLRWGLTLKDVFVLASEQGDDELIRGQVSSLIPFKHDVSLEQFRSKPGVYFSSHSEEWYLNGLKQYRLSSSR